MQNEKIILSDEAIIDLYWQRNEQAIHETDAKYKKYLYTVAYNILYDDLDCEEALNDTYFGAWNTIPPQKPTVFQLFLTKIMRNTAVSKFRRKNAAKRKPSEMTVSLEELAQLVPTAPSAEEEYLLRELAQRLNAYLGGLESRDEFAFVARYYCFDKIQDIADMLHTSERTVYANLKRMRSELKEILLKEGFSYE